MTIVDSYIYKYTGIKTEYELAAELGIGHKIVRRKINEQNRRKQQLIVDLEVTEEFKNTFIANLIEIASGDKYWLAQMAKHKLEDIFKEQ